MKVKLILWALESTQKAAKNVLGGLTVAMQKADADKEKAIGNHKTKTNELAELLVAKQAKLDESLKNKEGKIAAKKEAIETQIQLIQSKVE